MEKRYKSIFFDADDTLFDYPRAERAALLACLGEFALPVDPETFIAAYRRHNHDVWREFERGETDQATLRVERFRRLAAELGLPGLPLEKIGAFYLEALACQSQLLPGALELVRELAKRFPLALVTNGIASVQNQRFAASPITPYFQSIVISEEVGIAKPDPRISRRHWRRSASKRPTSCLSATASPRTWPARATPAWTSAGSIPKGSPARRSMPRHSSCGRSRRSRTC